MGLIHRRKVVSTDTSNTGWGAHVRRQTDLRLLVGCRRPATHQLPRDDGSMSSSSNLLAAAEGTPRASPLRQHDSGVLYKSPGRAHLETPFRDGKMPLGMGTSQPAFIEGSTCARRIEPRSRHAFSSKFPGRRTLLVFLQHPRQSDWVKQSDARPSIGVGLPGSPVSPFTGLGVHMA